MGVRKMTSFLINKDIIKKKRNIREFCESIHNNKINNNCKNGKIIIAIDFWLYAHKFLHSKTLDNIITGFWKQIITFLLNGMTPLYVIDGHTPLEKQEYMDNKIKKNIRYNKQIEEIDNYINLNEIIKGRQDELLDELYIKKEKLQKYTKKIKNSELNNIYSLFDLFEIPYIRATYEADALCAKLFKERLITACLSDDMDMLALGCGLTIKIQDGCILEFDLKYIRNELDITQEQFIDMCIMFGCDYLQHPFHLDPSEVYEMIKKHGSLLEFLRSNEHPLFNMNNSNVKTIGENYYNVKDIYLNSHVKEIISPSIKNIKLHHIMVSDIIMFLKEMRFLKKISKRKKKIKDDIYFINILIDNNEL